MLWLLLLWLSPGDSVLRDRVEIVEFNETYCDGGATLVVRQIIFWVWESGGEGFGDGSPGYRVLAFRLQREPGWPLVVRRGGSTTLRWSDSGRVREVRCDSVRYTRTLYDPEIEDRHKLDNGMRRGLRRAYRQERDPPIEWPK